MRGYSCLIKNLAILEIDNYVVLVKTYDSTKRADKYTLYDIRFRQQILKLNQVKYSFTPNFDLPRTEV